MIQDLPPTTTVEAVEIRPARLAPTTSEAAFSVIRLDDEQLDNDRRLDDALAQAPGVSLFRRTGSLESNPTTQGISLRQIGPSGAGRTLVTLEGVPQNDPFGGWVLWTALPPELIDSATILRGGGAGVYGAGALTGVIELFERSDYGLEANAQVGERNTQRVVIAGAAALGNIDFVGGLYGGSTDGHIPVTNNQGPADVPLFFEGWSANGSAATDLGDGRFAIRVGAFEERRGNGLLDGFARASGEHASATWVRSPTPNSLGYRVQAWVRTSDLENAFPRVDFGPGGERAGTTVTNRQVATPATGYGLNAAVRRDNSDSQWELGADMRIAQGETREQNPFNGRETRAGGNSSVAGIYAEGAWMNGPWLWTANVRADQWSNTDGHNFVFNPNGTDFSRTTTPDREGVLPTARLGLRREVGTGRHVRAAAYTGFRAPSINELHRGFRVGAIVTNPNSALTPERLAGAEVGYGFEGTNSAYSVTVFYNELTDAITNVTIGANLRQRQNAGTIEALGIEAEGAWRMTPALRARAAAVYTDAETEAGLRPQQTARVSATAGLDWTPTSRVELAGQLRYEGDRFDDDLNLMPLASATVFDAQASFEFGRGVQGFISGENIFDEDVENGETSGEINYAYPQTFSVGLRIRR